MTASLELPVYLLADSLQLFCLVLCFPGTCHSCDHDTCYSAYSASVQGLSIAIDSTDMCILFPIPFRKCDYSHNLRHTLVEKTVENRRKKGSDDANKSYMSVNLLKEISELFVFTITADDCRNTYALSNVLTVK